MKIRLAQPADLKQIVAIYNQAVTEGHCTADLTPLTMAGQQQWFDQHKPNRHPIFVMDDKRETDSAIIGWCSLSAHRRGRMALRHVAEISYYVDTRWRRKGVASRLIRHALDRAPALELRNLFAILLDINKSSVTLLEKNGFKQWGHLPDIAELPDRTCGQFIYGRKV